jgi:hypothetical protein
MPILVEAISIIFRREAIDKKLPRCWAFFQQAVPPATYCFDDHLAPVSFKVDNA